MTDLKSNNMSKKSTVDFEISPEEAANHPDPAIFNSKLKHLTEQGNKPITEEQLLLQAAGKGDVAMATTLLQKGTDIETFDPSGWTPLLIAVTQHQTPMVQLLLEYGAEPDIKCNLGQRTPLHQASEAGYADIVELLLTHKANPNLFNSNKRRPLVSAAAEGHLEVVKMLLDHGAWPQAKEDPHSPLNWAKRHGHEDIVRVLEPLCEKGAKEIGKRNDQSLSKSRRCVIQ